MFVCLVFLENFQQLVLMFPNKLESDLMNHLQNSHGDAHSAISSILSDDGMYKCLPTKYDLPYHTYKF